MKVPHVPPRVLFVGPLPPPIGGYTALFEALIAAWRRTTGVEPAVVDTSPRRVKSHPGVGSVVDLVRGVQIAGRLVAAARGADAVVFVATTGLFQRLGPVLRHVQRRGAPLFVWFSGGVVHEVIRALPGPRRDRFLADLRSMAGVIVETEQVRLGLASLGLNDARAVPNPRFFDASVLPPPRTAPAELGRLRLVFFSRIVEEKGILVLLDALRRLDDGGAGVGLDVYGTVDPEVAPAFQASLERTPTARYLGVFRGDAPALLAGYDAVVLPTWFSREGHPGVIVEAMMAGVPVVSTVHMAIPELIRDGENGLLVPPRDVEALAGAIRRLADDPGERAAMGAAHRRRLDRHDALVAAGRLLVWIESARDRPIGVHA